MNYAELLNFVAPETLVVMTALGVLLVDLTTMRGSSARARAQAAAELSCLGCGAALAAIFLLPQATPAGYLDGMWVVNPLTWIRPAMGMIPPHAPARVRPSRYRRPGRARAAARAAA